MTKEAALQEELSKIDVNEKLSACPIDFSRSKVANPRAGQKKVRIMLAAKRNLILMIERNFNPIKNHNSINCLLMARFPSKPIVTV